MWLAVDPAVPEESVIERAGAMIRSGALVAFPTETVYGLGANALDAAAVQRIFAAKGRPAHDPLIVHLHSAEQVQVVASDIPPVARELMERFWPGPLTLVLRRSTAVPDVVTAGGATVAVRVPNHPLAQALLRAATVPIAAPSANRFGHTSPTTAQHVWDDLAGRIDLILDGGGTTIGVESTVLDVTRPVPTILRHGGVTREMLVEAIGEVNEIVRAPQRDADNAGDADNASETPLASPGLLDRHYAPNTPLTLFTGEAYAALAALIAAAQRARDAGLRVHILAYYDDVAALQGLGAPLSELGFADDGEGVARALYAALRSADASGADLLLAREPSGAGMGAALRDRLRRAAESVVEVG